MPSPPQPFFMDGPCQDLGYQNTRDDPRGAQHKAFVEALWEQFHPLADFHFREDARNHFLERFWEMYLAVTLLEHGCDLHRHGNEGPEFFVVVENRRIWFEAVSPGPGTGPDQVQEFPLGTAGYVPTEKILLRYTNALDEKRKRFAAATAKGIVSPDDLYILAINARGIPHARYGGKLPFYIQAFLPIGPFSMTIDKETLKVTDSFYQYRPEVSKLSGSSVSTRPFLDEQASFCSAVLHSAVDCANHPDQLGGDFSILHNPKSRCPVDAEVFSWCERFTVLDDYLHQSPPHRPLFDPPPDIMTPPRRGAL